MLKNTLVFLLLVCLFAYHFGYHTAYFAVRMQVERDWVEKIYGDGAAQLPAQVRLLEIPITVAYMPDQTDFEETNALFEKDGQSYRIIKQRYYKDTLQVVYVPDTGRQKLKHVLAAWLKTQPDTPISPPGISTVKPVFNPYIQELFSTYTIWAGFSAQNKPARKSFILPPSNTGKVLSPPPELA